MNIEIPEAKVELKNLVDTFSNPADVKDTKSHGDLFLPDFCLEFEKLPLAMLEIFPELPLDK